LIIFSLPFVEHRRLRECLQVNDHNADGLIIACVLKESEKRPTTQSFYQLRRKELGSESLFLCGTLSVEVKEDGIQAFGVDPVHVPRYVNVVRFALGGHETAAYEDVLTAGVSEQAQRRLQFHQLISPVT
jgi:hypothetical protein